jgi:hypothetical protein
VCASCEWMKRMGVFDEKIAAAAGDMGERRFHRGLNFVPLRTRGHITFRSGVQPADGMSH